MDTSFIASFLTGVLTVYVWVIFYNAHKSINPTSDISMFYALAVTMVLYGLALVGSNLLAHTVGLLEWQNEIKLFILAFFAMRYGG